MAHTLTEQDMDAIRRRLGPPIELKRMRVTNGATPVGQLGEAGAAELESIHNDGNGDLGAA